MSLSGLMFTPALRSRVEGGREGGGGWGSRGRQRRGRRQKVFGGGVICVSPDGPFQLLVFRRQRRGVSGLGDDSRMFPRRLDEEIGGEL